MTDASVQIFAVALAAIWCGFGLYGFARMAARSPQGREMLERLRRSGPLGEAAALAMLVAVVAIGGTKPGGGNGGGLRAGNPVPPAPPPEPAFGLVEVRTEGVALRAEPTNAVEAAAWRLRGASEDGIWIECEKPFFALGTNPVRRVYASASGALSFGSARHPPIGAALPDGTAVPALAPFRASLGILPAANETNAAPSRFWHAPAPGGGLLVSWENVLVDRLPGRRATIQAELKPSGDFTYRYDFADALDPPATNFAIGAQAGTNGVNALAILGTNLLAETVWRVDGARVANGVPVADLLCTNGALRTPARFALEWRNTSGLDPNADSDGDGLSDWDEVFLHGTDPNRSDTDGDGLSDSAEVLAGADPLDADENGDGVPDGADPVAWAANPLWGENTMDGAILCVTLGAAIPQGEAATIVIGSLSIPLRAPRSYALSIPRGVLVPFRLFSTCENPVDLSIGGAAAPQRSGGATRDVSDDPIYADDPDGVFDGEACGGAGNLASPVLHLVDENGSEAEDFCLHDGLDTLAKSWTFSVEPAETGLTLGEMFVEGFSVDGPATVSLRLQRHSSDYASGTVSLAPPKLRQGWACVSRSIHRCLDDHLEWCYACDMYHDPDDEDACPHEDGCPAKTDPTAECTCTVPVIRVNGAGTLLSESAHIRFPVGGLCCCSGDLVAPFARIRRIDSNLHVTNETGAASVPDVVSGSAVVYATGLSGSKPSEIEYEIVHRHYDSSGAATNEATTNATMKVWAVDIRHEPVTTETVGGLSVNPSGIVLGSNALFRIAIAPTNFPSSLVSWEASPANLVSFPSGTNGTEVVVRGENAGDVTLSVRIAGYAGPPPICEAKVVPETVVQVHAFIICGASHSSTNAAGIQSLLSGANDIYAQVGRRFELASIHSITNANWLDVQWQSGQWPAFNYIVNYTNGTGGIEVYFVRSIARANGLTTHGGIVVKGGIGPNTLAHELGHAQDLPDVYVNGKPGVNDVTGLVSRARMPSDWGSPVDEGYYPPTLVHSNLVQRLLMYGIGNSYKKDISSGDIHSIWRPVFTSSPYSEANAPIGFFSNATSNPVSN